MFRWTPFPLVRITIALCVGILLGIYNPSLFSTTVTACAFTVLLLLTVLFYLKRKNSNVLRISLGLGCLIIICLSGILLVKTRNETSLDDHLIYVKDSIIAYEGVISDHLEEKSSSFKTTVTILRIKTNRGWKQVCGNVNFYISKNNFIDDLIYGDHIMVKGFPYETSPPANPYEFDYKRFLTFRNVYHQQYIRSGEWIKTGVSDHSFFRTATIARNYFTSIIKKYVPAPQEQAVVLALIIGVKDGIDNDILNAYAASGAMHVLAVSGLHVGIIYWMMLLVLKPFQKSKKGKWFVSFVCLIGLWSYAFVTGLSPSVLRAVMMFSFVAVARSVNQRSNIYNTLASSAFILLLIDPFLIMSVGFQLSYLAVIGIVWVQRPLYLLYEPDNAAIDWVWKISCVSIAAQATTFSLGLLYFHQFPTYFLFSNLIVIPTATLVLILGIVLLLVNVITPVASLVGWTLEKAALILNWSVFTVEDLPYSIVSNIYLTVLQSWLILGILVSFIFIFQFKRLQWLYFMSLLAIGFTISRWNHSLDRERHPQIVFYNISGATAIDIMHGGQAIFLADSTLINDKDRIRFHISGNRLFNQVNRVQPIMINRSDSTTQLFAIGNRSILFIDHSTKSFKSNTEPDYVVISRGGVWSIGDVEERYPNSIIVLDGSCSSYWISKIKSKIKNPNRVYSVVKSGALIQPL